MFPEEPLDRGDARAVERAFVVELKPGPFPGNLLEGFAAKFGDYGPVRGKAEVRDSRAIRRSKVVDQRTKAHDVVPGDP